MTLYKRSARIVVPLVLLLTVAACAARGPRNRAQIGALTTGEAVLAISNAEQKVNAANFPEYTEAAQDAVNAGILKALYASRAFERAVANWPEDGTELNAAVELAKAGVVKALDDLEKILPPVAAVRGPLTTAIRVAQAALAAWRAE